MKTRIIILLSLILSFTACEKEEYAPDLDMASARYFADDLSKNVEVSRADTKVLFTKPPELGCEIEPQPKTIRLTKQ